MTSTSVLLFSSQRNVDLQTDCCYRSAVSVCRYKITDDSVNIVTVTHKRIHCY